MEQFYVFMLAALFLLAIVDLVVGVSNDAVNFLNSAVGSRAASFRTILIVASLGVAIGAFFSSGLMEVARQGIFNPWQFTFDQIMILFMAVMITDVLLLDLFNSLALPTSTTVSIVFELLGASMAISAIKIFNSHDNLTKLSSALNLDNALQIIMGILISIFLAFAIGALVQWFSRLLFVSGFQKRTKFVEPIFSAVALTSISYFILIKGLKGVAIIPLSYIEFANQHTMLIVLGLMGFFTPLCFVLEFFSRVNILRVVVLVGTFALALAFAGNDLVNFIGVPIAALQSFDLWQTSYLLNGTLASDYTMEALSNHVSTPIYFLVIAGLIMVITLWWSKKARSVMKTEIDLSRSGMVDEKFNANVLSRFIVRMSLNLGFGFKMLIPKAVYNWFESSFVIPEVAPGKDADNDPAFDLVRASVNLMVASILISWATTMKLPLSTTYVTFMVAMGSSLADRAWGRESAVYRVAGVLNVIGGWIVTALVALLVSGLLAVIIYYGRLTAVVILLLATAGLLTRSFIAYRRKQKITKENLKMERTSLITINEIIATSSDNISRVMQQISTLYSEVVDHLGLLDLKKLRRTKKELLKLESEVDELKDEIFYFVKSLDENSVSASKFYILVLDYLQDMVQSIGYIRKSSYEHVNNNHQKLKFNQIREIKRIEVRLGELYTRIVIDIDSNEFKDLDQIIADKKVLFEDVSGLIQKQVDRIRTSETSPKNTKLYFSLLLETKDLIQATINLLTLFKEFNEDYKNIQRL